MGIITKIVTIKPSTKTLKHYKEKGYDAKIDVKIEVSVSDLTKGSHTIVECKCDYCNKYLTMEYRTYLRSVEIIPKVACKECRVFKIQESNELIYGVKNVLLLSSTKEKIKQTFISKYGVENPMQNPEVKQKAENTNIKKYGVSNPIQNSEIKQKAINTCIEHFGVENPFASPIIQDKIHLTILEKYGVNYIGQLEEMQHKRKNTMLERYNVCNPSQSPEIQNKKKQTFLEHYGVDNPLKSPIIKQKLEQTNIERYGYPCAFQSPIVQEKIRNTMQERYNCDNPLQNEEIHKKALQTQYYNGTSRSSIQQESIFQSLTKNGINALNNFPIGKYIADIVFNNIDFEIDYGGHDLSVQLGNKTQEEFDYHQLIRDKIVKSYGYKVVRLISYKSRKIPTDEKLLEIIEYARTFFSENPERSWISFDIDNSCIYNAYHKEEGEPYDFGTLRTIKKSDIEKIS